MASAEATYPQTYYIYTYAYPDPDPDGTVFYVGKGTKGRIDEHEREARSVCTCQKCQVIRQIWASGKPVQKRIVYETFDEVEALAYEYDLIKQYAGASLTNTMGNRKQSKASFHPKKPRRSKSSSISSLEAELEREVISPQAAAYLLGVVPATVHLMIRDGEIPGFKVRDVWRVYREDVEAYIQRQMERAKHPNEQEEE